MDNTKKVLIDCVGADGYDILEKSIIRTKTNSVADPSELYLPLLVVPRTILSWLTQNILPMKVNDHKDFKFPGQDDTVIHIEKLDTDVYQGSFSRSGKIFHRFNHQTLPSISGHLMTVFELYDHIKPEENGSTEVVTKILEANDIKSDRHLDQKNVSDLIQSVGKLVDALVAKQIDSHPSLVIVAKPKEPTKEESVTKEKEIEKQIDDEIAKEEIPAKAPVKHTGYFKKKIELLMKDPMVKGKDLPSGAAMPQGPKQPTPPSPPTNNQKKLDSQNKASATGKAPTATPKAPQAKPMAAAPKVAAPKAPVGNAPKVTAPAPKMATVAPKLALKSENYFSKKLSAVKKSEYFCTEGQLHKECEMCGRPQFFKAEETVGFDPCACYRTMGSVDLRKTEGGYWLSFKTSNKESINSFLKSLR